MDDIEDDDPHLLLERLARKHKLISTKEVEANGLLRVHISNFVSARLLERVGRGLYEYVYGRQPWYLPYATVCKALPSGVICALSAAYLHGLAHTEPKKVWVTVDANAKRALPDYPEVETVYMRRHLLEPYVQLLPNITLEVRLTSLEKTVIDAFRHRRRLGSAKALQILHEYLKQSLDGSITGSPDSLLEVASQHRMAGALNPYLDAFEARKS